MNLFTSQARSQIKELRNALENDSTWPVIKRAANASLLKSLAKKLEAEAEPYLLLRYLAEMVEDNRPHRDDMLKACECYLELTTPTPAP